MKIALNIIIGVLIFVIWADIETNSIAKVVNYSNSILSLIMLSGFILVRYYYKDLQTRLLTKK